MADDLSKQIEDILSGLSFDKGYDRFKANLLDALSKENLDDKTLRQLKKIATPHFQKELRTFWNETLTAYQDVLDVVNEVYPEMGGKIGTNHALVQSIMQVNFDDIGEYAESTKTKIAKTIRKAVKSNKQYKDIVAELSKIDGSAKHYAHTIARTHVKAIGRGAIWEKAKVGEVDWFDYVGIIREHTRDLCLWLLRQNRPFHRDEIEAMKNHNREPVKIYAGGWRCHHDWRPNPLYKPKEKK